MSSVRVFADQAAQQFANQFYDALMSEDGRYTVRQAFEIALNTVNADNPNAPPQGDHFLLLPPGSGVKELRTSVVHVFTTYGIPVRATLCVCFCVKEGAEGRRGFPFCASLL